jgi:hypothetical protein
MCAPRVTRHTSNNSSCNNNNNNKLSSIPVAVKNSINGERRSFGFLITNVCNHGEYHETPCIFTSLIPFKKEIGSSLSEGHAVGPAVCRRHLTVEVRVRSQFDVGLLKDKVVLEQVLLCVHRFSCQYDSTNSLFLFNSCDTYSE